MDHSEVLEHAIEVLSMAGVHGEEIPPVRSFTDYGSLVAYAARQLDPKLLSKIPWFKPWAFAFRDLYDRWDRLVAADPMLQYEPANRVAEEFHRSPARWRYFMAGNRTSKTQSGYAEHYFFLTRKHPYRQILGGNSATGIIAGLPFSQYAPAVWEKKFLTGEPGNPLSPMFPEGGKWFHHYDERKHQLTIACPPCANAGKAASCNHPKSTNTLFSSELGYEVLQGAVYNLIHFDEDLEDEKFFDEARQRIKTVRDGCGILTGTPLHGDQAWEQRRVVQVWKDGPPKNLTQPEVPESAPMVSVHTVSMYDAGLVPKEKVDEELAVMDEYSVRARIYGEPVPISDTPVFDRKILHESKKAHVKKSTRGWIKFKPTEQGPPKPDQVMPNSPLLWEADQAGPYRIWEQPKENQVYIAGIDTAAGLIDRDASCCSVLRLEPHGFSVKATMVAQYHGWANPSDYADHLLPLLIWYNSALAIIETTGGLGLAVALRMKNEYGYWNMYREVADHIAVTPRLDPRLGIDTNTRTKPFMVAALQGLIKERRIIIPCADTYDELFAYEEVKKGKGGAVLVSPKYQGAGGSRDDRTMSLAIAAAVIYSRPDLCYASEAPKQEEAPGLSKDMTGFQQQASSERTASTDL